MPIGLPLGKFYKNSPIQNMAMLIHHPTGLVIMAFDLPLGVLEAKGLKSHRSEEVSVYMKQLKDTIISYAESSSNNKIHNIHISSSHSVKLPNNKYIPISRGTTEIEHDGILLYKPIALALVPEAKSRKIALFIIGGKSSSSTTPDRNFTSEQEDLEEKLIEVIVASELDERLALSESHS